jgi:hypothetical protein
MNTVENMKKDTTDKFEAALSQRFSFYFRRIEGNLNLILLVSE